MNREVPPLDIDAVFKVLYALKVKREEHEILTRHEHPDGYIEYLLPDGSLYSMCSRETDSLIQTNGSVLI